MSALRPTIINRAQWGANPLVTPAGPIRIPTPELWLHHTGADQFGAAGMRLLQSFTLHRPDAHYVDLEYTFVMDRVDGTIYESRGPGHDTAATGGHNAVSHAICVMGNFEVDPVSALDIERLANLVAWGFEQGWWPLGFTGGHRDAPGNSTACPGDHLEAAIPAINARARAIHLGSGVDPPPPLPQPSEEDEMYMIATDGKPTWLLGAAPAPLQITVGSDVSAFVSAGIKVVRVSGAFNDRVAAAAK